MEHGRVNERILEGVRRQSGSDRAVSEFLIELIYREADHPFRWKEIYKKALMKASEEWSEPDED